MVVLARSEVARARVTGALNLSYRQLESIPDEVFQMKSLRRLDLGCNRLKQISKKIGDLKDLEELWLNGNPIVELPKTLEQNRKLRELDLRNTPLRRLPNELGRLNHVHLIDLAGSRLKPKQQVHYDERGTHGLMSHLENRDKRKQAKIKLLQRLREGVYRELWDLPGGQEEVRVLVKQVFLKFENLEDAKTIIRNAERLFPEDIEDVDLDKIQHDFESLRRDNQKKKLAAELELKLRVIYFDRIRVDKVEGIVHDIYREVHDLEDIQFLIRYAPRLLPPNAEEITGELVAQAITNLQAQQAKERADAIKGVENALKAIYSHVDPSLLTSLCEETTGKSWILRS